VRIALNLLVASPSVKVPSMTAKPSSRSSISYFLDDAAEHSSDSSSEDSQQASYDRESSFIDDDELSDNELRERWLTRYGAQSANYSGQS